MLFGATQYFSKFSSHANIPYNKFISLISLSHLGFYFASTTLRLSHEKFNNFVKNKKTLAFIVSQVSLNIRSWCVGITHRLN